MLVPPSEIERQVRSLLAALPARMQRDDLVAWLRERLPPVLRIRPADLRVAWRLDALEVEIPTRPHYIEIVDDLHQIIQEAAAHVDIADVQQLTDEQFRERARGLRGDS